MNRTEFLNIIWRKAIKPTLIVLVIFFCVKLIISFKGIIVGLILLYIGLELILLLFNYLKGKASISLINNLIELQKYLNILSIIFLPIIIYFSWQKDAFGTMIILSVLLISKLLESSNQLKLNKY